MAETHQSGKPGDAGDGDHQREAREKREEDDPRLTLLKVDDREYEVRGHEEQHPQPYTNGKPEEPAIESDEGIHLETPCLTPPNGSHFIYTA